jgi:glycosyltransferase involved in cell wall biosynthesis
MFAWRKSPLGRMDDRSVRQNLLPEECSPFFRTALSMISHPSLRFRWVGDFGDDSESAQVKRLLADAGAPKEIEVTGWVSDPQRHLAALDTFCMFSRYESFGYVTAEAMLLGVPVLATPSSGTVDLVKDEDSGHMVPPT